MCPAPAKTLLFHVETGIPECLIEAIRRAGVRHLKYTNHALWAADNDHFGPVKRKRLPYAINCAIDNIKVIEVEVDPTRNEIVKVVFRMPYSSKRDLIMAVAIERWAVKTVWTNYVDDCHTTLDRSRYNLPTDYYKQVQNA